MDVFTAWLGNGTGHVSATQFRLKHRLEVLINSIGVYL